MSLALMRNFPVVGAPQSFAFTIYNSKGRRKLKGLAHYAEGDPVINITSQPATEQRENTGQSDRGFKDGRRGRQPRWLYEKGCSRTAAQDDVRRRLNAGVANAR
jgi:hypothetical protein